MARSSNKVLHDEEFGDIEIHRVKGYSVSIRFQTDGRLIARLPRFGSLRNVQKLLDANRSKLRQSLARLSNKKGYLDGDLVGKSHHLRIITGDSESVKLQKLDVVVTVKPTTSGNERARLIKDGVSKALRKEAKAYLPRRLEYLAEKHDFSYDKIRFTHAKSRWGSCTHRDDIVVISLNIMLMTLPNELIDYILLHELTHIKNPNHSSKFWSDLENVCPRAKEKRREAKDFSPYL
ncbi:MAG: M48 family metallopeptidase [Candidatus Nomurabacteria bacterium]|jgi:predicted metal-dependent hydrolase|nr:M48 family metallopeptidase [Candidatus Nomurabacteria bacterium]